MGSCRADPSVGNFHTESILLCHALEVDWLVLPLVFWACLLGAALQCHSESSENVRTSGSLGSSLFHVFAWKPGLGPGLWKCIQWYASHKVLFEQGSCCDVAHGCITYSLQKNCLDLNAGSVFVTLQLEPKQPKEVHDDRRPHVLPTLPVSPTQSFPWDASAWNSSASGGVLGTFSFVFWRKV